MASAPVPSIYRKLRDISTSHQVTYYRPLVAISHNEYFIIAEGETESEESNKSIKFMKYSLSTDEWTKLPSDIKVFEQFGDPHFSLASNGRLFMVQDGNLQSIDLDTGSSTFKELSIGFAIQCVITLGEQVHAFGFGALSNFHCLIDTVTGCVTEQNMDVIQHSFHYRYPIYQRSRNRIIIYSACGGEQMFIEASLQNQKYSPLDWSRSEFGYLSCLVSSLDERFVVGFGGRIITTIGEKYVDQILVYDFKTQTVFESEIKCPKPSTYHAVSLGSKEHDELTVFGFINQSYKDAKLRTVQSLPIHVVQMMCKWYCNERVSLLACGSGARNGHWSINFDEIIRKRSPIKDDK